MQMIPVQKETNVDMISNTSKEQILIRIIFGQSRSKLFARAKSIAASFPIYQCQNGKIDCAVVSVYDFCKLQIQIHELIKIVSGWKNSEIWMRNAQYKREADFYDFLEQVKETAGKYAILINEHTSTVALGQITIEDLPYPIVYYPNLYGAFFAFSKDIGEPLVFCECERVAIENYIKLRRRKPLQNYSGDRTNPLGSDCFPPIVSRISKGSTNPLSKFDFKEGICFRCNKIVPHLSYCLPMYGGGFKQHYGWYIQQEYYKLGIDKYQVGEPNVLEEVCDPETFDSLKRLKELQNDIYAEGRATRVGEAYPESYMVNTEKAKQISRQISQTVENSVRMQLGFKKIGDAWISETILYEIVRQIFEGEDIERHYRPSWLEGLELDIYVPGHKVAFEYQGIQHFRAVDHWGGEKQLRKQQEHDARKKKTCLERGINLICINYYEPLTTEFVINRLKD